MSIICLLLWYNTYENIDILYLLRTYTFNGLTLCCLSLDSLEIFIFETFIPTLQTYTISLTERMYLKGCFCKMCESTVVITY